MKRYPVYKDSGVEGLGEIPEHWEVKKLKYIKSSEPNSFVDGPFGSNLKSIHYIKNGEIYVVESGFITSEKFILKDFKTISKEHFETIKRSSCKCGDIIISKIGANFGMSGILPNLEKKAVISGNSLKLTINTNLYGTKFIHYQLLILKNCGAFDLIVNATAQPALSLGTMNNIAVVIPPLSEQKTIAHFLDHKLEQIEQFIRNKKRLIELLNEQKAAIINRAVTKGINPNAAMKHSGIQWLGEIPAHWEVKKMNFMTKRIGDGIHSTPQYVDSSEYYFINGNNLVNGNIVINKSTRCVSKEEFGKYNLNLDQDTLLLSINGTIGNVAFYNNESVILGKSAAYITLKSEIFRKFAYYFLSSKTTKNYFFYEVTGTTIFNLSLKSIKNTFFPTPPPEEQKAIVFFIESQSAKIDFAIAQIEKEIELIQEYRTTLISDAVTGKIDVRPNSLIETTLTA